MTHSTLSELPVERLAIEIRGIVQGVGFRPFVFRVAVEQALAGWVRNEADRVYVEVQGPRNRLDAFCRSLRDDLPRQARIDALDVRPLDVHLSDVHLSDCRDDEVASFEILPSTGIGPPRPAIPSDLATCAECLDEIRTPGERRWRYPFTNCTNCGPRWSIIERLPYDRPRTSMARFAMCVDCRREYDDPTDRRFHAQPVACPACGPRLEIWDGDGRRIASDDNALKRAAESVRSGRILAIQGLGGFQLVVDATDAEAVARLRRKKQRPDKAFAIMLPSLDAARRRCQVSRDEALAMSSHEAPILLLRRREDTDSVDDVAAGVAPGNPYLGVMLPCTPLHHLLIEAVDHPIVCTSGNLSEEPMAIAPDEALERLRPIADWFLVHNRPIVRSVDDSVGRMGPVGLQLMRRARGFAPVPIELGFDGPTVLAVGGHLKNTVALTLGSQAIITPHVGDLDNVASVETHRRAIRDLVEFFDVVPEQVVCDLHPDYASTRHAEQLAAEWGVPLVRIQHHHAHVAACQAEHQLTGPVLGFAFDGTGHGTDGTVWGGEVLRCEGPHFERVARLRTFSLPGGDRAVREPRRSALGLLFEIFGRDEASALAKDWFRQTELDTLGTLLARAIRCPVTSSLGRLFDAVACLCGLVTTVSFEGQAAMALEYAADDAHQSVGGHQEAYPIVVSEETPAVIDWEPLVRAVLEDRQAGRPATLISTRFHNALAEAVVAVAERQDCGRIVLTGGCFQNALLSDRVQSRLLETGFDVYTHQKVPPGDGGLALGQAFLAVQPTKGR